MPKNYFIQFNRLMKLFIFIREKQKRIFKRNSVGNPIAAEVIYSTSVIAREKDNAHNCDHKTNSSRARSSSYDFRHSIVESVEPRRRSTL